MPHRLKSSKRRTVGTKQTLKALEAGGVRVVFVAKDADDHVTRPVRELCRSRGIEIEQVDSMRELGRLCGIDVGAAAAAVLL